ncbi:MAG: hypothetical protein IID45_13005, partial [Planctomycetes bacterium]|nr:hypothetical protein [Planctomycetota bacterium]
HQLALRAMTLSAHLLSELLAGAKVVANREDAEAVWEQGGYPVLNAHDFLNDEESAANESLPHTWDCSSDSIAAWIAIRWPADELVLLKSVDAPSSHRSSARRETPPVDSHFQRLSPRLKRISWCNLRTPSAEITAYREG